MKLPRGALVVVLSQAKVPLHTVALKSMDVWKSQVIQDVLFWEKVWLRTEKYAYEWLAMHKRMVLVYMFSVFQKVRRTLDCAANGPELLHMLQ